MRHLGGDRLTFRRLANLAERLAGNEESDFVRSVDPERQGWTLARMLEAEIVDQLRLANWMRTKDGQDGKNRPEPITRPGVGEAARASVIEETGKRWAERKRRREEARARQERQLNK